MRQPVNIAKLFIHRSEERHQLFRNWVSNVKLDCFLRNDQRHEPFFSPEYCDGKTLNSSLKYLVKFLGLLKPTS